MFIGYLAAIIIGGDTAAIMCSFMKTYVVPFITYLGTVMVLFGLILMYLSGEVALSASKKKKTNTGEKEENKTEKKTAKRTAKAKKEATDIPETKPEETPVNVPEHEEKKEEENGRKGKLSRK